MLTYLATVRYVVVSYCSCINLNRCQKNKNTDRDQESCFIMKKYQLIKRT